MATDYTSLIPHTVAEEVVAALGDRGAAILKLARVVQMPSGVESVPVVSAAPTADWVNPTYGGLKPAGSVEWQSDVLQAGEIGCVIPVPNAFIDDTTFDVGASVRDELARAFAQVFERSALYGAANMPANWPIGGLTAAGNADAVSGGDALAALDAALSKLEADGVTPDGILGGAALRAALRQQMVATLAPFEAAPPQIWGVPIVFDSYWDDSKGIALVGGWENVVVGLREDMTYDVSTDGVITDAAGKVLVNALQQDSIIIRAYMRAALTLAEPLSQAGTPMRTLALAQVVTAPGTRSSSKAAS